MYEHVRTSIYKYSFIPIGVEATTITVKHAFKTRTEI